MAEILGCGALYKAFRELGIEAKRTYKGSEKPYYQVWELSKDDAKKLEYVPEWKDEWGWFCYSSGASRGTPFEFLTINNQFVIGWTTINKEDTFDCLTDYLVSGLGVTDTHGMYVCASTMAKTNGWSLSQLWSKLEG